MLYRTVDAIWRAAGDTTTDYNFYTKRATLAAVYSATMLAFLADDTDDLAKTEAFLDRRLKDVSRIPKMAKPVQVFTTGLASVVSRATSMMGRRPFRR
jgi:ubiquinone biosynthesis protein COQ9